MVCCAFEYCATIEITHLYQNNIATEDSNGKDLSAMWEGNIEAELKEVICGFV